MVDKITSVRRDRIRERIGKVSPLKLTQIEESVLRFLGFESRKNFIRVSNSDFVESMTTIPSPKSSMQAPNDNASLRQL